MISFVKFPHFDYVYNIPDATNVNNIAPKKHAGCSSLQAVYCVAYVWNRSNKTCQLMPRLLANSEFVSGDCTYFVEEGCHTTSSACPSDFNLCLRNIKDRRFHLHLTNEDWAGHNAYCKNRSMELAEFPHRLEDALRAYFSMFKGLLTHRLLPLKVCNEFSDDNIQCQAYIGAAKNGSGYKWVRNDVPLEANFTLPNFEHEFKKNEHPYICFNVMTNKTMDMFMYQLKDQRSTWPQPGLCECFL